MHGVAMEERWSRPGPKRILALDGGGIRGLVTLGYLERLESLLRDQHQQPDLLLCDYFDLIGGTSTGSIIATGLAMGMSASEIKQHYLTLGKTIFGKKKNVFNFITKGEKYDIRPLNEALQAIIGEVTLGDQKRLKTGLCIVAKRADTFSTWSFINHPGAKYYPSNKDIPLWKLVRASAAAPTYFLPLLLDVGEGEIGAFIDGGISMSNNPSLRMLLIATLKGFPYQWKMGPDHILMVSLGTGMLERSFDHKDLKQKNLFGWAAMLPEHFMSDANHFNQLLMQILSDSPVATEIDSEVGDLKYDSLNGSHALSYLRYDVTFGVDYLVRLGYDYNIEQIKKIVAMDNTKYISLLAEIGERAAMDKMRIEHIPSHFKIDNHVSESIKRFTQTSSHKLQFDKVVKVRTPIESTQIHEPFEVETIEGIMRGKAGDYLMKGVRGEYYVCDQSIYHETYEKA